MKNKTSYFKIVTGTITCVNWGKKRSTGRIYVNWSLLGTGKYYF